MKRWYKLAALVAGVATLAGVGATARVADAAPSATAPIQVGVVYSRTGLLASYGAQFVQGLRYGIAYATKGTNAVNGRKIELTLVDDGGDPVEGGRRRKGPDRQGVQDHHGHGLVGDRAPARAARRPEQGPLHLGPGRDGRRHRDQQVHVPRGTAELPGRARRELVPRRRRREERHGLRAGLGVRARQLPRRPAGDGEPRRPEGEPHPRAALARRTSRRSPSRSSSSGTDLLFIAWAGTTAPAMWRALDQQGVFSSVDKVVTGLDQRASYPTFGPVASKISFLSHYVSNAPKNKRQRLARHVDAEARARLPDLFTPDGFVAGQMIVRALSKGSPTDVARMISALEGWSFTGPKGQQTIRASDHAMLQPMFQVKLVEAGGKYSTAVTKRLRAQLHGTPGAQLADDLQDGIVATEAPILATHDLGLDIGGARIVADVSLEVARGRARRDHRAERGREDDALQPPLGRRRADRRTDRARRARTSRATPPYRRTQAGIGRSFQVSSVFPLLPVEENVRLAAEAKLGGAPERRAPRDEVRPGAGACDRRRSRRSGSPTGRRGLPGCSRTATSGSSRWRCSSRATRA